MCKKYADIIIDISHEAVDRPFQYEIPAALQNEIAIGSEVVIPFGQGNRERHGYVIGFSDIPALATEKIKQVSAVSARAVLLEGELIALSYWLKENYGGTMLQALRTVLPVKEKIKQLEKKTVLLAISGAQCEEQLALYKKKHALARYRLLTELIDENAIPYELVRDKLHVSPATLKGMETEGVITVKRDVQYRNVAGCGGKHTARPDLNDEQQAACDRILQDFDREIYGTYLLHGITGSGKTEVYLRCIEHIVSAGRQAIMLIPEIALTYQTVKRFRQRFGDRVTILNSKMSKGERYDQYVRMKKGEVDIVIGPRSALFAPFMKLGVIVIDEEHETTYKNETLPCYHSVEVARWRADRQGACVLLGSATPSVTSYKRAMDGEYTLLELTKRAAQSTLATVHVVDLRQELKAGNRGIFSGMLLEKMEQTLARGEQIMLFLNRRGYESALSCRNCGASVKCPHCDVSLTLHGRHKLLCHYCGYEQTYDGQCPSCHSKLIAGFQMGTEKLEQELLQRFPNVRTLRMDADTVSGKDGHETILERFEQHEADILVGTQMIVKGHDFGRVTLMGILVADMSLHDADYMSAEKTFDLLTQAAGRAGRGDMAGEVVIQTYQPEHYSIVAAKHQDYHMFFEQELAYRELLSYPPAKHMLVIMISSEKEHYADSLAAGIVSYLKREFAEERALAIIGPGEAMLSKMNDIYRRVVYLKHKDRQMLVTVKNEMEQVLSEKGLPKHAHIQFDFNPLRTW